MRIPGFSSGRYDENSRTDAGRRSMGILKAHVRVFGSGELKLYYLMSRARMGDNDTRGNNFTGGEELS